MPHSSFKRSQSFLRHSLLMPPLYIVFNVVLLLVAHSSADQVPNTTNQTQTTTLSSSKNINDLIIDNGMSFVNRLIKNGVDDMEFMDFIFVGCLVLLGLELISVSVIKFSSYFKTNEFIPVRGKHLDDLSSVSFFVTSQAVWSLLSEWYLVWYGAYTE